MNIIIRYGYGRPRKSKIPFYMEIIKTGAAIYGFSAAFTYLFLYILPLTHA